MIFKAFAGLVLVKDLHVGCIGLYSSIFFVCCHTIRQMSILYFEDVLYFVIILAEQWSNTYYIWLHCGSHVYRFDFVLLTLSPVFPRGEFYLDYLSMFVNLITVEC